MLATVPATIATGNQLWSSRRPRGPINPSVEPSTRRAYQWPQPVRKHLAGADGTRRFCGHRRPWGELRFRNSRRIRPPSTTRPFTRTGAVRTLQQRVLLRRRPSHRGSAAASPPPEAEGEVDSCLAPSWRLVAGECRSDAFTSAADGPRSVLRPQMRLDSHPP